MVSFTKRWNQELKILLKDYLLFLIGIIIGFVFLVVKCNEEESKDLTRVNDHTETIVIDGCEYEVYKNIVGYKGFFGMAHKGQCKNV